MDDSYEQDAEEALLSAQQVSGGGVPNVERIVVGGSGNGASGGGGHASDGVARRRRRSLRFTSLRKPKWKVSANQLALTVFYVDSDCIADLSASEGISCGTTKPLEAQALTLIMEKGEEQGLPRGATWRHIDLALSRY